MGRERDKRNWKRKRGELKNGRGGEEKWQRGRGEEEESLGEAGEDE